MERKSEESSQNIQHSSNDKWLSETKNLANDKFVEALYQVYLGRQPDLKGLKFHCGRLQRGEVTREKLLKKIKSSKEYNKKVSPSLDETYSNLEYRQFIILSSPRSGTHMLKTSLDMHPNVICSDEMFNPDYYKERYSYTGETPASDILKKYIFSPQNSSTKAVGFCIQRTDAGFGGWSNLWNLLQNIQDLYVISLTRDNGLRRYLSFKVMQQRILQRKSVQNYKNRKQDKFLFSPLEIPPEELLKDFKKQKKKIAEFEQRFSHQPTLKISYEQLCDNYSESVETVQKFLGVDTIPLQPQTTKIESRLLSDSIKNYGELKESFENTEWQHFFEE